MFVSPHGRDKNAETRREHAIDKAFELKDWR
jgi:hypothetical protein